MSTDCKLLRPPFELTRNQWGRISITDNVGKQHHDVAFVPLFPITHPGNWISVITADGIEVATIITPQEIKNDSRSILEQELTLRDFVPRIRRVLSVSGTSEPCEWHVDTNHGQTKFVLKAEEDIRRLSPFEVMVIDANGGRYRVDDTRLLDARSRRFVEWYV
jgi:hypothetical protein